MLRLQLRGGLECERWSSSQFSDRHLLASQPLRRTRETSAAELPAVISTSWRLGPSFRGLSFPDLSLLGASLLACDQTSEANASSWIVSRAALSRSTGVASLDPDGSRRSASTASGASTALVTLAALAASTKIPPSSASRGPQPKPRNQRPHGSLAICRLAARRWQESSSIGVERARAPLANGAAPDRWPEFIAGPDGPMHYRESPLKLKTHRIREEAKHATARTAGH